MSDDNKKAFDKEQGGGPAAYMAGMILFGLMSLIFLCLICTQRKSLQTAIDVIDASADYIAHNKRVIAVPNLHFLITLFVSILWIGAMLCVASLNEI
jgi:hypothetical protein